MNAKPILMTIPLRRWYARDNRYIYSFDGAQLWRYTADPETSSLNLEGTTFGIWLWRKLQKRDIWTEKLLMTANLFLPAQ
ncbi:hypothetical protein BANRA_05040 [Escherichia coli]|nr:hypothetical protein BANRA_05040 [Escherichia coli]